MYIDSETLTGIESGQVKLRKNTVKLVNICKANNFNHLGKTDAVKRNTKLDIYKI